MLYIFSQDDKYQNIITEETGLIDTWFKDYENHLIDEPFVFHVESDSDLLPLIKDENQVAFYDRDNRLRLMRIKGLHERSTSDGYIVEVKCEPSFLELYDHFVEDRRINNGTAQSALNAVLQGSRYIGAVTVDLGNQTTNFYWVNAIDGIFKIIDVWGGVLVDTITLDENNEIIERKIIIQQRLGADNGLLIEPDYNAESIERSTLSYPVTAMYGQGASLETENGGYTRYITFENVEWSISKGDPVDKPKGQKWIGDPQALQKYGYLHNGTRKHRFGHFSNQDYETPEEVLWATWQALQEAKHPEVNHEATITVDRPVSLGDTATIIDRNYNKPIEVQSQITGLEYDILEPDEQVKVVLGKYVDMNVDPMEKELDDLKQEVSKPRPTKPIDNSSYPNIKPGTPTNVQAIGSFQVIQLYWDYDSAVYVNHYEVYASKVKDFVPDSQYLIYRGRVSAFGHEVQTDEMWYYRIRAVNTRGTPSEFSNQVSAASVRINTPDIMFGGIIADHLENNLDIAEKLAQNTIDKINAGPMQEIVYTQQQIEATEQAILNQLNSQIGDVNSAINSLNTTADNLKLRVDDTEDLLLQHGNKFTNIETEIDTIDGRISATITNVERIDNTVNSHSTTLTAHAGLINAKLDSLTYQTDKTGLVNRIESNETEIGLLSTGLELRVTKEEFESLSIGGRNLFIVSEFVKRYPSIYGAGPDHKLIIKGTDSTSGFHIAYLEANTDYLLTFSEGMNDRFYGVENKRWIGNKTLYFTTGNSETGIVEFTGKFYPINNSDYPRIVEIQLEKGNKATDWTPAPEDIDNQFTTITNRVTKTETTLTAHAGLISAKAEKSEVYTKTEVNTRLNTKVETTVYNNKVGQLDVSINNITSRVSNTETNINGLTGEVNTAKSQIGQLEVKANQVDIRVSEIRTGLTDLESTTGNLVKNPELTGSATGWTTVSTSVVDFNGTSTRVLSHSQVSSGQTQYYSDWFTVDPSKAYEISMWVRKSSAVGIWYLGLNAQNASNATIGLESIGNNGVLSNSNNTNFYFVSGQTASTTWTQLKGYLMPAGTDPSSMRNIGGGVNGNARMKPNTRRVRVRWLNWNNGTTAVTMYAAMPRVVEISSTSMSQVSQLDASITTLAGEVSLKASQTSVNSLTGRMSSAESQLNVLPGQISAKVDVNGVIASINLSKEGLRIDGNKHHITGQTLIDNGVIGTAAIANAAIAKAHLQNAIIDDAHINNMSGTKIIAKTVNADKLNVNELRAVSARTGDLDVTGDITLTQVNKGLYLSFENLDEPSGGAVSRLMSGYGRLNKHHLRFTGRFKEDAKAWRNGDSIIGLDHVLLRQYVRNSDGSNGQTLYRTDITAEDIFMVNAGSGASSYSTYARLDLDGLFMKNVTQEAKYRANMIKLTGTDFWIESQDKAYFQFVKGTGQSIRSRTIYDNQQSTSGALPVYITGGQNLMFVATSSEKFKINIERGAKESDYNILKVPIARWHDKKMSELYAELLAEEAVGKFVDWENDERAQMIENLNQSVGVIAEDLHDKGLTDYVIYSDNIKTRENVLTIDYSRLTVPLMAVGQKHEGQIYDIETRLDEKDLEIQYLKQKVQQQDKEIKQIKELLEVA